MSQKTEKVLMSDLGPDVGEEAMRLLRNHILETGNWRWSVSHAVVGSPPDAVVMETRLSGGTGSGLMLYVKWKKSRDRTSVSSMSLHAGRTEYDFHPDLFVAGRSDAAYNLLHTLGNIRNSVEAERAEAEAEKRRQEQLLKEKENVAWAKKLLDALST